MRASHRALQSSRINHSFQLNAQALAHTEINVKTNSQQQQNSIQQRDMWAPVFIHSAKGIPAFFVSMFSVVYFRCCCCSFSILLISDFFLHFIYLWLLITIKDYSLSGCVEWACVYAWVPNANTHTIRYTCCGICCIHFCSSENINIHTMGNIITNRPNKQLK